MKSKIIAFAFLFLAIAFKSFAGDINGTVKCIGARDSKNVVVFLTGVAGDFKPPAKHPVIDQKGLEFIPHVLPVVTGTTVDFLNSDDVMHNVYSPSKAAEQFNLGSWPKGQTKSYTFTAAGDSVSHPVILCNVHPEMSAYVVVLKNKFFAVTDKAGNYTIKGVPAGKYKIIFWHEKLKSAGDEVEVSASGAVTKDIELRK